MKWPIVFLGCCILTATANGQEYAPRSSSPTGIRPDAAAVSANFALSGSSSVSDASGSSASTGNYTKSNTSQSVHEDRNHGGGVAIQGNTSVNASTRNMDSRAVGAGNTSCASLGSIGECAQ